MNKEKDERPGVGTEALEDPLRRSSLSLPTPRTYPAKIRLSDTADAYIAALAVDLAIAEVELPQLPDSLMEFHTYAFEAGRASRQADIDRLRWERDLWYFVANNRGKRPSDYYKTATDRLWAEASA